MKIHYMSDLHLEMVPMGYPNISGDILVLAGDITTGDSKHIKWIEGLDFKHIIYIAGNHEFYHGDIIESRQSMEETFKDHPKIHFMNDEVKTIEGIKFVATTLWTDFNGESPLIMEACRRQINDFRVIRNVYDMLHPRDIVKIFNKSLKFLTKNVTDDCVVVTHHAPSFLSVSSQYKGSELNGGFANSIEDIMLDSNPKLWIHGHMHNSVDYVINKTRVLCNPKGYGDENKEFDINKFVEI